MKIEIYLFCAFIFYRYYLITKDEQNKIENCRNDARASNGDLTCSRITLSGNTILQLLYNTVKKLTSVVWINGRFRD